MKPVSKPTIKPTSSVSKTTNYKHVKNKPKSSQFISFLNRTKKIEDFKKLQSTLDCFATNGAWKFDYDYHRHYRPDQNSHNNSQRLVPCFPSEGYMGQKAQCNKLFEGNMTFYQWKVPKDRCGAPYKNFDVIELCRLFAGRSIMFVGDSMTELMVLQLFNSSRWQIYGEEWKSYESMCQTSYLGCRDIVDTKKSPYAINRNQNLSSLLWKPFSREIRVIFKRNDILSLTTVDKPWSNITKNIEAAWITYLDSHHRHYDPNIRLIVLNRGIHFQPDTTILLAGIRQTLFYLRKNFPHVGLVWRSTVHGHYDAMEHFYEHPLQSYNIDRQSPKDHPNYHYHRIESQNQKVLEMLKNEFPEVIHLDVLPSTRLRRGGHRDPLHYCIPGPMDQWNELLVAVLRMVLD